MPLPTDPLLSSQWYLINLSSTGLDLNVAQVWNPLMGPAYTGARVTIAKVGDAFDYTINDFDNYDTVSDFDVVSIDADPFGLTGEGRGTALMGILGASSEGTNLVCVAQDATRLGDRTP